MAAEADESDKSFLRYRPEVAIVTAIEADHLENYNGILMSLLRAIASSWTTVNLEELGSLESTVQFCVI